MQPLVKSALSLLTIVSAALVLLADSADDPSCSDLDVRADYVTDCFGGDTGTVRVRLPGGRSTVDAVTVSVEQGKMPFVAASLSTGECDDNIEHGRAAGLAFGIKSSSSPAPGAVCEVWQIAEGTQTVSCTLGDAGTQCSLSLTLKP